MGAVPPQVPRHRVLTGYPRCTPGVLSSACVHACVRAHARSLGSTRAAADRGLVLCAHVQQHRRLAGSARTRRCKLGLACAALQLQPLVLPFKLLLFELCAMADPFSIYASRAHIHHTGQYSRDRTFSVPRSHSPTRTRIQAHACTHAHRQACARAHACACTHKHTGTRTVTRCPHT